MAPLKGTLARYGTALASTATALAVTRALEPFVDGTVLPPTLAAVVFSATLAGLGPGLVAVVIGALALKFLFMPELHTFFSFTTSSALRLGLFLALGIPLAVLAASARSAAERLRRAVRARNDILAIVSHDLRSPLNTISLTAEVMADASASDVRCQAQRIQRAASRMDRLINDLLDFASIDAGSLTIEARDWPVFQILEEAFELAEPMAGEKGIRLASVPPTDAIVHCDRHRIVQVLGNLLGNSMKFTPAGGRIALLFEHDGHERRLGVRDAGPGIAHEHVPRIFDRYWQGHAGDARGAGLGLAIAKGIVEAHGGRIWVDSTPGHGATFWFTLSPPAQRTAAPVARTFVHRRSSTSA